MRLTSRWITLGLAVVVAVAAALVAVVVRGDDATAVTARASSSAPGHGADGVVEGGATGWRSSGETTGAWIELRWSGARTVRRVVLGAEPGAAQTIRAGFLTFGDGSQVQVRLPEGDDSVTVPITARSVDSVRFTVSEVADGATSVGVGLLRTEGEERIDADVATDAPTDGDVMLSATLSSSSGDAALAPLADGTGAASAIGDSAGSWVEAHWARPRELTTVAIAGATGGSTVKSATITFGDGSTLAVGAVLPDPDRPTVVSFMPRVTTSVRLVVDAVAGTGDLDLAEISVYQRGAPALHPSGEGGLPADAAATTDCPAPGAPGDPATPVVLCPANGTEVGDSVDLEVAAPSYASVSATIRPSGARTPAPAPARGGRPVDGTTTVQLDLAGLPAGPFTVHVVSSANGVTIGEADVQLVHRGSLEDERAPGPRGRSLVYADEFDGSLSVSRTGAGADYAAGKPVVDAVEDFGDGPFADPARGLGTVASTDDYLRVSVLPAPAGSGYPEGQLVGGMLASARPGGSGFSAQYGYFEARMLAPAGPGTWPSFWMLPSPNLVTDQPYVAEIDTVELYGHNPTGACHSTHQYPDPEHVGIVNCGERWSSAGEALQWHTYGADVEPTGITFSIDGEQVASAPQVRGGSDPLFFMLDLALGGGWPVDLAATGNRADLYVDWVRVYV